MYPILIPRIHLLRRYTIFTVTVHYLPPPQKKLTKILLLRTAATMVTGMGRVVTGRLAELIRIGVSRGVTGRLARQDSRKGRRRSTTY